MSNEHFVEICYYEDLMDKIETEVSENRLNIKNSFRQNWTTDYKKPEITVYLPRINYLELNSASGFSTTDTIRGNRFELVVNTDLFEACMKLSTDSVEITTNNSNGEVTISGASRVAHILNYGKVYLDARQWKVQKMRIYQQSSLDATIYVTDSLRYWLIGMGDLIVNGNPAIDGVDVGDGKLIIH